MILSLWIGSSIAQNKVRPDGVVERDEIVALDVFVLRPGSTFVNRTDSTYFALPRYRLERLTAQAVTGDTLKAMWFRDRADWARELESEQNSKFWWRTGFLVVVGFDILATLASKK